MPPGHDTSALGAGLALGGTYLISIGPNKMMIIREGLVRGRTGLVASTVLVCYLTLLTLAYCLTDRILAQDPALRIRLSWLGVAVMNGFAVRAIRAGLRPASRRLSVAGHRESVAACLRRTASTAVVNPLLYLEFFFIPSAVCGSFDTLRSRFAFACGLAIMATVTCYGYAFCAHACTRLAQHRRALQAFDLLCGLLLGSMALALGFRLWFQSP